jgi:hypothetical protein
LFNSSIVPHPDQSDAPKGGLRFILSLRAVGEGHVSLTFRAGTIAADGSLSVDPTARSSPPSKRRVALASLNQEYRDRGTQIQADRWP